MHYLQSTTQHQPPGDNAMTTTTQQTTIDASFASNLVCPISSQRVDSYVSRTTVFLNAIAMAGFMVTGSLALLGIVVVDYGIRMMGLVEYSPVRMIALPITRALRMPTKTVDLAPKLFASRLGWMCAVAAGALWLAAMPTASLAIAGMFLVLMLADSLAGACLGCAIYTYVVLPISTSRPLW
jgi:hypothetical protein